MDTVKTAPAYTIYKMGKLLDQSVQELDPLSFDQYFVSGEFSCCATALSAEAILSFAERNVNQISFETIAKMGEVPAMAAARDLNMVASAVTRFGIPMHTVPQLESFLILLAEKTREVPTDTVFGYGARNPKGNRRRSFTRTSEEDVFIDSFTEGMNSLTVTLAALETVQTMSLTNGRYSMLVREAMCGFQKMSESILNVRKHISPDFFTHKLRPFFEPKTIRGKTYFAAGGAQMPVTVVDLILWGVEDFDRVYVGYRSENLRYLPRFYQAEVESIFQSPSILQSVSVELSGGAPIKGNENVQSSLAALKEFADQIIRFRAPHLGVAKANMKIRSAGSVGSGGYDLFILQHLIDRTKKFRSTVIKFAEK
jgi:monodechloroaminopyrrolnitrin synthase